jgi:hypothetical protein
MNRHDIRANKSSMSAAAALFSSCASPVSSGIIISAAAADDDDAAAAMFMILLLLLLLWIVSLTAFRSCRDTSSSMGIPPGAERIHRNQARCESSALLLAVAVAASSLAMSLLFNNKQLGGGKEMASRHVCIRRHVASSIQAVHPVAAPSVPSSRFKSLACKQADMFPANASQAELAAGADIVVVVVVVVVDDDDDDDNVKVFVVVVLSFDVGHDGQRLVLAVVVRRLILQAAVGVGRQQL